MRLLLPLVLLAACTENEIISKDDAPVTPEDSTPPEPDPGHIEASASGLDLGVICEQGQDGLSLRNVGDGPLTITALTPTEGWSVAHEALPVTLPSGRELAVLVTGTATSGSLRVESDDPIQPVLTLPLTATANQAPTVSILAPSDQEVLGVGAATAFDARVSDDADAPEALSLSWSSDVDGVLSTDPADGGGRAGFTWDAAQRSSGNHTVTLTATDACGASTNGVVVFCQNAGYLAENLDLATWHFEGSARWDGNGWVELTNTGTGQAGTAFQTAQSVDAAAVSIAFSFYVSGGSGADGMSVTALDTNRMTGFVGTSGGGIGYGGLPGWSLEIDTWWNSEYFEPSQDDHIALSIDGDAANPVIWATLPEMEDGAWHQMELTVSGTHLVVAVDGVAYIDANVPQLTSFPAYVGFTAATGAFTNFHLVDALEVENFVCGDG